MAFWTPYAQEVPLDLTKRAVKVDKVSPLPASAPVAAPLVPSFPFAHTHTYYATYPYQPVPHTVPSISPDSVGSWSHRQRAPQDSPELYDSGSLSEDQEYQEFERDALRVMAEKNGGTLLGNNPRMRRAVQTSQAADDSYRRQRERNNCAAKQSRDRRKLRELRLSMQVTYLKKKVAELKARLSAGVCGRCRQICLC